MLEHLRRLRSTWNTTDTIVVVGNTLSFFLFLANCWWESVEVTYAASVGPLVAQGLRWRMSQRLLGDRLLGEALVFGLMVGALWPIGEWIVVNGLGWWGSYLAAGPKILETPLYCVLVGWLASTYCYYVGKRAHELGYGRAVWAVACGGSAFFVGIVGENFLVAARMWEYEPSAWDWGQVPAFVPISYGISYGAIPLLRAIPVIPKTILFTGLTLVVCVTLGLATGFFPR
jgi:hypothetical protein